MGAENLKQYEHYKDSGIAWLGKVPAHWEIRRIKDVISNIASGTTPKGGSAAYVDKGIPFLRSQNVHDDGLRLSKVAFITAETNAKMRSSQARPDDIALNITGASIGRSCVIPAKLKSANISQHILLLRFKKRLVPFIAYYIKSESIKKLIDSVQLGASKQALNMGQALNFPLVMPPIAEQHAIAHYLHTHTASIDKETSLLKQKISKYYDLKKALINDTVCRGLNLEAPCKPSGVGWLGDIPAHWQVRRFKDVGKIVLGKMLNTTPAENYFLKPYLKSKNISRLNPTVDNIEEMYFTSKEMISYRVKKNDLLLSEGGEVGKTCIWNDELEECYIQNSVHKITISKHNNPRYFLYASFLMEATDYYNSIVNQVSIKHLTWEKLINVPLAVPPLSEQIEIAAFLDNNTQTIDAIISNLKAQIVKLKDLRKTLINDVVTGKLKVTE